MPIFGKISHFCINKTFKYLIDPLSRKESAKNMAAIVFTCFLSIPKLKYSCPCIKTHAGQVFLLFQENP